MVRIMSTACGEMKMLSFECLGILSLRPESVTDSSIHPLTNFWRTPLKISPVY